MPARNPNFNSATVGIAYGAVAGTLYLLLLFLALTLRELPDLGLLGLIQVFLFALQLGVQFGGTGGAVMGLLAALVPGRLGWTVGGILGGVLPLLGFLILIGLDPRDMTRDGFLLLTVLPGIVGGMTGLMIAIDLERETPTLPLMYLLRTTQQEEGGEPGG